MRLFASLSARLVALLLAGLAGSGCGSTTYRFRVDALAAPPAQASGATTYRIASGSPQVPAESTQFETAARHVRETLAAHGMFEAPDPATADLEIVVDFGIGSPRAVTTSSTEPAYEMGTIVHVPTGNPASPMGRPVYLPTEVHNVSRTETRMVAEVYLTLVAREGDDAGAAQSGQGRVVWSVYVTGTQEQPDVDALVPLMLEAAREYIGTNPGERLEVVVSSSQPRPRAPRNEEPTLVIRRM